MGNKFNLNSIEKFLLLCVVVAIATMLFMEYRFEKEKSSLEEKISVYQDSLEYFKTKTDTILTNTTVNAKI